MILLDWDALLLWTSGSRKLPPRVHRLIDKHAAEQSVLISALTLAQVGDRVRDGSIELSIGTGQWADAVASIPGIRIIPMSGAIASRIARMEDGPEEFADRIIVATAQNSGAAIVSGNSALRRWCAAKGWFG